MKHLALIMLFIVSVKVCVSDEDNGGESDEEFSESYLAMSLGPFYDQFMGMSDADRKEKFKEYITDIDEDKDGKITMNELTDWTFSQIENETLRYYSNEGNITALDLDKDGRLSFEEAAEDLKNQQATADENVTPGLIEREQKVLKLHFELTDEDKDGFISKDEYPRFMSPNHFADLEEMNEKKFALDYDSNGDGLILRKEFIENAKYDPNFESVEQMEQQFKDYDKDGDGVLSVQEIQSAARATSPLYEVANDLEVISSEADTGKKGFLTHDELAEQYKFFTIRSTPLPGNEAKVEEAKENDEEIEEVNADDEDSEKHKKTEL